jgi:hypothetical protein
VVEASRKHGPFDLRWAFAPNGASAAAPFRGGPGAEPLDWDAFSSRHFAGRKRHDMEALTAYAVYTNAGEGDQGGTDGERAT